MKWLLAIRERHLPWVAPTVMIGALALTAVGAQFLDDHHAPTWLKWLIGAPWLGLIAVVGFLMTPDDDYDEDEDEAALEDTVREAATAPKPPEEKRGEA